jgi:hypothetical protein
MNPGTYDLHGPKLFSNRCLQKFDQAAWGAVSSSGPLIGVKYLSKVLIAASKTI